MSRVSDFCDDGFCAALAVLLAFVMLLLGIEFLCRMAAVPVRAFWRAIKRACA